MPAARIVVDRDFTAGPVPRRIFGSFVEHMGRCVYTGIFEPGHPQADEDGFRTDVLELTRELGVSVVRYPGGNFVSGYNWEDGVGPVVERPRRLDGAWHTIETNAFGLHEFTTWAKEAGVEVMEAVNLGTRGVEAARSLVEYANHPGGAAWSDARIANGARDPFGIRLWCLGNEMDGPWQIGHKTADEYGRLAAEAARAMRYVDPSIELVACGSSGSAMPTFGAWEQTVLRHAYDQVDYVSLHAYYEQTDHDVASFVASAVDMDHFIESVIATADAIGAADQSSRRINLSFDEWNVWSQSRSGEDAPSQVSQGEWREHPRLIEDAYTVTDAVVVGTLLNSLLRHGDRVTMTNGGAHRSTRPRPRHHQHPRRPAGGSGCAVRRERRRGDRTAHPACSVVGGCSTVCRADVRVGVIGQVGVEKGARVRVDSVIWSVHSSGIHRGEDDSYLRSILSVA